MSTGRFAPAPGIRVLMLLAAYAPLLVLMAVLDSFGIPALRWVLGGTAALAVLATALFFTVGLRGRNAESETVVEARPREGEALRFFASYVVPFFVTQSAAPTHQVALGLYVLVIAVLYLQGDMYFANPLLGLFGYRVFELRRPDGGYLVVLSRSWHLAPGQRVALVPLGGYVFVHRRARARPDAPQGER
ncbi:hypothetical protein JL107_09355 [Nakamurella flavida]|uniref:Uncharacterized protein n=1 Tax=Nakamurella flavida TaxID=363630 RepID=A0A938YP59_9ACTN|nr:hypothetical protein [Nakamurella flavida]MBM9476648.1 hypothetical protein [Nakamurella flavida]MDP9778914.1 hypothetical protein [Nakamurella flavida]